jgi:hypothetical protein
VLSLSYQRTQSDESFSKAELYKNFGLKTSLYVPGGPIIDIAIFQTV